MFDGVLRRAIDPTLGRLGARAAAWGWQANSVTLAGFAIGIAGAAAVALGAPLALALVLILLSRVADGLDGAIARVRGKTDFGGYLDITADFAFYGAVPLGFALRDPAFALPAAFLLASFYTNCATFLAYAILAEKHGLQTTSRGEKSLYFTAGLLEGGETIAFFTAICLWPAAFPPLAAIFGALCFVTALARVLLARASFGAQAK